VGDRQATYVEIKRLLKRGGCFACIDMSTPKPGIKKILSTFHVKVIMPLIVMVAGVDREAYRYLTQSTARFPTKETLAEEWRSAGFVNVSFESLMMGNIAIHVGFTTKD